VTTLDLHIGLHKTGTTTLQSFFVRNEAALAKHSIVYPRTAREGNSHRAILGALGKDDSLKSLMANLHAECAQFKHALVSAEGLSRAFLKKHRLARVCQVAARHFHTRIIIYLRRQDELKTSIFGQVAREWYQGSILDENSYEYDHLKRLDILQSVINKNDLIVRRYRRDQKVEHDFLKIYGLSAGDFETVPAENIALNRRITDLVARLDKRRLESPERFLFYLASSGLFPDDGQKHLWSPQERMVFLERFEASNREVANRHFPESNGQLFEAPEEDDNDWLPVPNCDEEERWGILVAKLWNDYVRAERRQIPTFSTLKKVYSRALRKFWRG
jgi:hypothetical protein